ncbi:mannose-6-phosphate isomerase 2 isoform X2 [Magnolia sinica]|uniref:mannose-6-phosphate isomerase 2 isoform X2 n=1 Tax=Magnolia sinica TaxID=86752 RepID=UPI0026593015|nr:mannose-6-phosphate isomerase 2 isoform X2 [Magnolia sinica]
MEHLKPLRLRCFVQNYDWGRSGEESTVAKLFSLNSNSMIDPDKPYAELWMGTHESGPSFLAGSETDGLDGVGGDGMCAVSLKSWIDENAGAVGEKVVEKWGRDLPFLFKELKGVLVGVPEVVDLVGHAEVDQVLNIKEQDGEEKAKAVLRSIFTQLMSAGKDAVFEAVAKLKSRLNTENKVRVLSEKEQLVLLLEKQYPSDVGVISAFFFNFVKLNPGEALYLGANEPHAYIYGECIECMATSDNVVRAGLTPKYRDVQTLCSMLTYKQGFPEILHGIPVSPYTRRYLPPFDEFEVDHCCLPTGASAVFPASPGPSIFVVIAGEGSMQTGLSGKDAMITDGDVFFIPAECEISITAAFGDDFTSGTLQLYRAGVNSRCFK